MSIPRLFNAWTSRPLHEGVDWNITLQFLSLQRVRRPLHEGVDWNVTRRIQCRCTASPSSRGRGLKCDTVKQTAENLLSPSSRGRGLKSTLQERYSTLKQSPSSRGRGLKFTAYRSGTLIAWSPSSRGRGLKSSVTGRFWSSACVALFTRAWIEMISLS